MDRFDRLWELPTFREAVRELVSYSAEQLSRVGSVPLPTLISERALAALGDVSRNALGAAETLRRIIYEEGIEPTTLAQRVGEAVQALDPAALVSDMAALTQAITPGDDFDSALARAGAEHAIHPVLEGISAAVDLRSSATKDGPVKFVPVVSLRISFDEPVSASNAVSFQLSPGALDDVVQALTDARDEVKRLTDELKDLML